MITKLTKHGSSWVLVIDEPVLDLMKIDPETTALKISTDGETMTIGRAAASAGIEAMTAELDASEPLADTELCGKPA